MDRLILLLIARLSAVWRQAGAEPAQLLAILRAKLTADRRRTTFMGRQQDGASHTWFAYILLALMGLFVGALLLAFDDRATGLAVYFFVWLVFMLFTLISDFTDVLIDVRDNYILLPRPVSDRTLTLARLLHILVYLGKLVLLFTLGAQLLLLFRYGWYDWLLFALLLLPGLLIAIGLVSLIYLLVLQLTHPYRFREVIGYFQVGFSILIFSTYYLLPQIVDFDQLRSIELLQSPWSLVFPGSWLAGVYQLLRYGDTSGMVLANAGLGLLIPGLLFGLSLRLAPSFSQQLIGLGLAGSGAAREEASVEGSTASGSSYRNWMAQRLTRPGLERHAFQWVYAMMARSRDFKLKTYPSLGIIPVLFLYLAFTGHDASLADIQEQRYHLLLIYISAYGLIVPLTQGRYSEKFRAAWVFDAFPLANRGAIGFAQLMAVATRFLLPCYAIVVLVVLSFWGLHTLGDLAIGLAGLFLMGGAFQLLDSKLPFSQEQKSSQAGANIAVGFLLMVIIGLIGGLHYLASSHWWLALPFGLLLGALALAAMVAVRE